MQIPIIAGLAAAFAGLLILRAAVQPVRGVTRHLESLARIDRDASLFTRFGELHLDLGQWLPIVK